MVAGKFVAPPNIGLNVVQHLTRDLDLKAVDVVAYPHLVANTTERAHAGLQPLFRYRVSNRAFSGLKRVGFWRKLIRDQRPGAGHPHVRTGRREDRMRPLALSQFLKIAGTEFHAFWK